MHIEFDGRMIANAELERIFDRSSREVIEALSRHLPRGTEESLI